MIQTERAPKALITNHNWPVSNLSDRPASSKKIAALKSNKVQSVKRLLIFLIVTIKLGVI